MPTYEYRCKSCGHELEAVQSFTEEPLTDCPSCGEDELKKVYGAVGISFKGSGFYKTDNRGKSSSGAKSSSSPSSDGGGSSSPSTDSGSSSKSETATASSSSSGSSSSSSSSD